jgi:hypothetical protein
VAKVNGVPAVRDYPGAVPHRTTRPVLTAIAVTGLTLLVGMTILQISSLDRSVAAFDASQAVICTGPDSAAGETPSKQQLAEHHR